MVNKFLKQSESANNNLSICGINISYCVKIQFFLWPYITTMSRFITNKLLWMGSHFKCRVPRLQNTLLICLLDIQTKISINYHEKE